MEMDKIRMERKLFPVNGKALKLTEKSVFKSSNLCEIYR